jgi:hypothetical protein
VSGSSAPETGAWERVHPGPVDVHRDSCWKDRCRNWGKVTGVRTGTRAGAGNTPAACDRGKAAGSRAGGFPVQARPNTSYCRKVHKCHPS